MTSAVDAVVIGAGPNGLVAANRLADAGWDVLVLEQQPTPGGAVRSDRDVHPDFVHDTFSAFYPLSAVSPPLARLRLADWGLQWSHAPAAVGNPDPSGGWALLHREPGRTAASLDALHPGDGETWLDLFEQWQRISPGLIESLLTPFPPVRGAARLAAAIPKAGGLSLVRTLVESSDSLTSRFRGVGARMLIAGNAAHADLHPQGMGSGLFGLLLAMLGQQVGFPAPTGGAGELIAALVRRFEAAGGRVRCGAAVNRVDVVDGRAVAVRTADGDRVEVRRAVIADVTAPQLYGGLVPWADLPDRVLAGMRRFRWDPGTVKVDWALSGPIPWAGEPAVAPGYVHLADSIAELSTGHSRIQDGILPQRPYLLVGAMTTTDPTRSPKGTESVWSYTHVPRQIRGDAGARSQSEAISGRWTASDAERMADRMQARIEKNAPGFSDRVLARRVLSPRDLEARDANLIGGALGGGTSDVSQQLVFRPIPGLGRAETPIKGLYLGSSSAHPGGGVHGAAGDNAARAALAHARLRPWRR